MTREESTAQWYRDYRAKKGADRNDLRANRGVLFQDLAIEASVVRTAYAIGHDPRTATVLDVGIGGGSDLYHLFRLGYRPENITGIDICADHLAAARKLYPQVRLIHGDAARRDCADSHFDLVFEVTMFVTLPNDVLRREIAAEMVRVCKPGGYLLLVDWRTPKPRNPDYKALSRGQLKSLSDVGVTTRLVTVAKGALAPPVGRFLSSRLSCVYFAAGAMFPFLVSQVSYVLQKLPIPTKDE